MKILYRLSLLLLASPVLVILSCNSIPQTSNSTTQLSGEFNTLGDHLSIVFLSKDSGITWQPFSSGLPSSATITSFTSDKNRLFATTRNHGVFAKSEHTDWLPISTALPKDLTINCIVLMGDKIIVGTANRGVWTSLDQGKTWEHETIDLDKTAIRSLIVMGDQLLAGTNNGIYKSTDQGKNWIHVFGDFQINGFTSFNNKIYAAAMNGALLSEDRGLNWRYIYQPHTLHDISNDGQYVYAMTLGDGLLISDNDGLHWDSVDEGLDTINRYTFEVKKVGNDLFAAQWLGIYRADPEGKNWQRLGGGLPVSTAFMTMEMTDFGLVAGIGLRK